MVANRLFRVLLVALAAAQCASAQRLEFEVASVKENVSDSQPNFRPSRSGDLITWHNVRVFSVMFYAYNLTANYQVEGYDKFADWAWYDFDVRAPKDATEEQVRLMYQTLLADRFKLEAHRATKEVAGYDLVIKGSPKLTASTDKPLVVTIEGRTYSQSAGTCGTSLWREGSHLVWHAAGMDRIASSLSANLAAPVTDRTGLKGTYDFDLHFVPNERKIEPDLGPVPLLEQAVQEVLGLKLEKGKAKIDTLVVDHLEKPSAN